MDHKKVLVKTTLISLLVFIGFNYIVGLPVARAETRTVCDSGCDYTTFADAHTAAGSGDVISIITDNINFGGSTQTISKDNITVRCGNGIELSGGDATTESIFYVTGDNVTIDSCTFINDSCDPTDDWGTPSRDAKGAIGFNLDQGESIAVTNNNFDSYLIAVDQNDQDNPMIATFSGNTVTNGCGPAFRTRAVSTVTNNTITTSIQGGGAITLFNLDTDPSATYTVTGNTITLGSVNSSSASDGIVFQVSDLSNELACNFSDNKIIASAGTYAGSGISLNDCGNTSAGKAVTIQNNIVKNAGTGISLGGNNGTLENVTVQNNTTYSDVANGYYNENNGLNIQGNTTIDAIDAKYNIFDLRTDNGGSEFGFNINDTNVTITTLDNDYNLYYGLFSSWERISDGYTLGTNSIGSANPVFTDETDFVLCAPSQAVEIDGTNDAGAVAYAGSRSTTFSVDDDGSGCTLTTITEAVDGAASGDTINVAAGIYSESVSISDTSLTITGAGDAVTTISAIGEDYAINASNFDDGSITGFSINNASIANVYLYNESDGNTLSNFIMLGSPTNIILEDSDSNTISSIMSLNATTNAVTVSGGSTGNAFSSMTFGGNPTNAHINLNNAISTNFSDALSLTSTGNYNIYLWSSTNNTFADVTTSGASTSNIYLSSSSDSNNFTVTTSGAPGSAQIYLDDSDSNTFTNLNASNMADSEQAYFASLSPFLYGGGEL